MANYVNTSSTIPLQKVVNIAAAMGDIMPIFNLAGSSTELPLTIANDVMNAILSDPFPYKFNDVFMPQFLTSSFQQDYCGIYPNGTSVTNLSWLERGIVIDINNTAQPKPYRLVECGRQLPQATGTFWNSATNDPLFLVNWFPNYSLYYGTWGDLNTGNLTLGNNPIAGSVYTNPIGTLNGQAISQPANPITQIEDANGNFLVLTTYGIEGTTAPLAPVSATPGTTVSGTNATTIWTVVDPYGQGFRILPVPSQTGVVWQFNLWGQALPIKFTSLQQTLFPLPDQYEPNFRQLFIAQCYRYSPEKTVSAKFQREWQLGMEALANCRKKSDRELEENVFTPDRSIMGGGQQRNNRWAGGAYPFNYPGNPVGY
jgi:hypothetical protein